MEEKKILVTGAAGFIGSQLAHRLWKEKKDLILLDNFSYGKADNLVFEDHDFSGEVVRMDIRDRSGIARIFTENEIGCIFHIAGIAPLPDCQMNPQEAIDVNVAGTVNLLENARRTGCGKMVFASTNAMYENVTKFPTAETDLVPPTLIYPNTKFCAERFCESFCRTYGMSVTCLRFANVYGPHIDCLRKQPPFVGYMIRELFYGREPVFHSDGLQRRDYIYVDDLIDLALRASQVRNGFDAVNVSSNQNYSVRELYAMANRIMHKDIPAKYVSADHYWEKYPELYQGKFRISPEILEHEVNKYSLCDNTAALQKYGWKPRVSMEDGLAAAIEYEVRLLEKLQK